MDEWLPMGSIHRSIGRGYNNVLNTDSKEKIMIPAYNINMSLEDYKKYYNYGSTPVVPKKEFVVHPVVFRALFVFAGILGKTLIGALL